MKGKNFIIDFFKRITGGRNFFDLPKGIFDTLQAPDDVVLVEPFVFNDVIKKPNGLLIVLPNVPMIMGTVVTDSHGYKKGEEIIYNKDYIGFLYYTCEETGRMKIGVKPNQILFKRRKN